MTENEITKTVADLTEALGLPEHEQEAVAAWCGEDRVYADGSWVRLWTADEMAELVRIWHLTAPESAE
jgi:hypothetical protein